MRNITEESRLVMNTRRNFVNYAHVTLHDGTELNLTPSDFRISGNNFTDDWNEGESFQLGSAIGKTATLLLDNTDGRVENTFELQTEEPADWTINYTNYYRLIEGFYYPIRDEELPIWSADTYYTLTNTVTYTHGKFSEYDFYMAYFELYLHLPKSTHYQGELIDEVIPIGTFTVTTPASHGSTIEITGVDNMHMFDKSFDDCTLDFSTGPTLLTVLNRCCQDCGVAIGYSSFLNESIRVYKKPEGLTYRQAVSYIAQIAGCNAVINVTGALVLKYYDMTPLNEILDGGRFDWLDDKTINEGTYVTTSGSSPAPVDTYVSNRTTSLEGFFAARIYIDNISDLSAFNCKATIYYYSNSQYTTVETITLVEGYNDISTKMELQDDGNITWYTIRLGQQNSKAISFDYEIHITENLDGGSFEPWTGSPDDAIWGGNFTDILDYHNLTATNGTSVSTDDIHFTGIMVSYEIVNSEGNTEKQALHYPDVTDWDTYAMHIEDNPFVETQAIANTVATSVWDIISPLNFRPFTTSSIQDPTIEAGDCALVYDVKGNIYPTVITNVRFTTGGMTEVSCTAESPIRQNTRYVNPAARAEAKAIQKQDDYNAMVAHFNELANTALGYYKTQTTEEGATVTYIHDNPTKEASTIIWKITAAGYFVSEDGGQSWNTGYDASTGTMLMNLIYVKGIQADWIDVDKLSAISANMGTVYVGGGSNGNGVLYVRNASNATIVTLNNAGIDIDGGDINLGNGAFHVTNAGALNATSATIKGDITADTGFIGGSSGWKIQTGYMNNAGGPTAYTETTKAGTFLGITGILNGNGSKYVQMHDGKLLANDIDLTGGKLAGLTVENAERGLSFNNKISDIDHYFKLTAWGGITCGRMLNGSWARMDYVQQYAMLKIDYGNSSSGYRGIIVTNAGNNTYSDAGSHYTQIVNDNFWSSDYGSVAWSGSDKKLKKNIEDLTLDKAKNLIDSVRPREFEFNTRDGKRYGFIAQELREVLDDDSGIEYSTNDIRNINYNDFIAPLCMIVKEQQAEIDDLKKRVEALETLVNTNK